MPEQVLQHPQQRRAIKKLDVAHAKLAEAIGLLESVNSEALKPRVEELRVLNKSLSDLLLAVVLTPGISLDHSLALSGWVKGDT